MREDRLIARMVGEGFSEELIFEQRPKGSERTSHVTIQGKRSPGRVNVSIT